MGRRGIPVFFAFTLLIGMLYSTSLLAPSFYSRDAFALEADGIIDNNPPFVEILSATDSTGNALVSGDSIRVDSVTFEFNGTDDIALDHIGCSLQSIAHFENVSSNCASPISYKGLSPGVYQFGVAAVDLSGNSALVTFHFTIEPEISQHIYCDLPWYFYNVIDGSVEGDLLNGTDLNDLIRGFGGDDVIDGHGGNDCITGNGGDDVLLGGPGEDGIYGGIGDDEIHGNDGTDTMYGNDGDDLISGGDGDDYIAGKTGNDSVFGNNGNDKLFGNEGDDFLKGGDGDDIMFGGEGHDVLLGNTGEDRMSGQEDDDALLGGRGDDRLSGGDSLDELDGGKDRDNCKDDAANFAALAPQHCEGVQVDIEGTIVATSPDTDEVRNEDFDINLVGITTNGRPFLTTYGKAGETISTTPGLIYAYAFTVDDGPDSDNVLDHYLVTSHGGIEDSSEVEDDTEWHAHGFEVIQSEVCSSVGLTELIATEDGQAFVSPDIVMLTDVQTTVLYEVSTLKVTATPVDGHVCINVVGLDNVIVPDA